MNPPAVWGPAFDPRDPQDHLPDAEETIGARLRRALAVLGLLLLAAILIAVVDVAFIEPDHQSQRAPTGLAAPDPTSRQATTAVRVGHDQLAQLPRATTFATLKTAPRDPHPASTPDGLLLRPKRKLPLFDRPGGRPFAALPTRQLGGPTWVPIINDRAGWLRVLLPSRPNGTSGWIARHDSDLHIVRSPYRLVVDLDRFRLTLHRNDRKVGRWTVGIGKPAAPTPRGRTFILAALRDPNPTFSKVIVPLGAHSDTHRTYGGGPGTVGIHSWPTRDVYGRASSDGCIRVPPDALTDISTTVPIGTPVLIR